MKTRKTLKLKTEEIVRLYVDEKISQNELAKMCGCFAGTIKRRLLGNNIKLRTHSEAHSKYIVNEKYFEDIDCNEKAYWLGFIYADGNLRKNSNAVIINLSIKDIKHLEKFKLSIESNAPIKKYIAKIKNKGYPSISFSVTNEKFRKSLEKLGLFPNKSDTILMPKLPEEYMSSFLLGCFDGDGSISNKHGKESFDLTANLKFLKMYDDYLNTKLGMSRCHIYRKKKSKVIGRLGISGVQQIAKIYMFLYSNCGIFLDRKHNIFKQIYEKSLIPKKTRKGHIYPVYTNEIKEKIYENLKFMLATEVSKKMNIPIGTIKNYQKRFKMGKIAGCIDKRRKII